MTAVLDPAPPTPVPTATRRRAWLLAAVVGLVVLVYLTSWTIYARAHTEDRFRALPPGQAVTVAGAEWRLTGLVTTTELAASSGEAAHAGAGASYVVATVERTPRTATDFADCTVTLLGPGHRQWEPASYELDVTRDAARCSTEDLTVGRTYRFETLFVVPAVHVDQLVGMAVPDPSSPARVPVLRPPG